LQDGYSIPHKVQEHRAKDLIKLVTERKTQGELMLIMGDFNKVIGERNQGFTKLCSECHFKDMVFERHDIGNNDFNTYAKGKTY
jgi:hypothetical protein